MLAKDIKVNLNKTVIYGGSEYTLHKFTVFKPDNLHYQYEVILLDKCKNSIVVAAPSDIELKE